MPLREVGGDGNNGNDDERRRFKIVITQANVIDLNTIKEFCEGNRQTEQTKEIMVRRWFVPANLSSLLSKQ